MSPFLRVGARMSRSVFSSKTTSGIEAIHRRPISWMAFEQPNPALYTKPVTVQPKRPVVPADSAETETAPPTPVTAVAADTTTTPGTATQDAPASAKITASSSTMKAGPMPLSQNQKRSFRATPALWKSTRGKDTNKFPTSGGLPYDSSKPYIPTFQLCLKDHPATWPVRQVRYPTLRKEVAEWIAESELISKRKLPRC